MAKIRSWVVSSIILLLFVSVWLTGCTKSEIEDKGLVLEKKEFDFGILDQFEIWQGKFEVSNLGNQSIQILDVTSSCGCTTGTVERSLLAPGESGKLDVTINAQDRDGNFGYNVTVVWQRQNDKTVHQNILFLYGMVSPIAETNPLSFQFDDVDVASPSVTRVVRIQSAKSKIKWDDLVCTGNYFNPTKKMIAKGIYDLTLTLYPAKFPIGSFKDEIKLSFLCNGKKVHTLVDPIIPVTARIVGKVKAEPRSVYLGAVSKGSILQGEFDIQNTDARPIELISITSSSPDTLVASLEKRDSNDLHFGWKMKTNGKDGPIYQKLLIKVQSSSKSVISIPVIGYLESSAAPDMNAVNGRYTGPN